MSSATTYLSTTWSLSPVLGRSGKLPSSQPRHKRKEIHSNRQHAVVSCRDQIFSYANQPWGCSNAQQCQHGPKHNDQATLTIRKQSCTTPCSSASYPTRTVPMNFECGVSVTPQAAQSRLGMNQRERHLVLIRVAVSEGHWVCYNDCLLYTSPSPRD